MFLGFILALFLNEPLRGRNIYRAIIYMPAIISPVVIGVVWQNIYDPYMGVLANTLRNIRLESLIRPWLADPKLAIFSIIVVNIWQWTGWSMLMYLAGLQSISKEIFEAATIDGASAWQRTLHITWPMLSSTHLTLILLGVIGTLQTFAIVYVLTQGGPNHASELLTTHIFTQAFTLRNMGYASTVSVILLVLGITLSVLQLKFFRSGVYSRGE